MTPTTHQPDDADNAGTSRRAHYDNAGDFYGSDRVAYWSKPIPPYITPPTPEPKDTTK